MMLQEHVRIVRTGLLNRLAGLQRATVLITSAGPSAGKTTVALMLSRSLAQTGRRVLLVDVDLYRPSVASRLGVRPPSGLEDVLEGRLSDQEAVMSGDIPNLDLLPIATPGRVKSNELLANGVFQLGLQRWRERYDFVIMDSCPLLPVADGRILLPLVDGAVLVAREGHCRHDELVEALRIIERSGGNMLGTVFVGTRSGAGNQYREYY
jgi:capsular exopolysaccharide synthesis family protein